MSHLQSTCYLYGPHDHPMKAVYCLFYLESDKLRFRLCLPETQVTVELQSLLEKCPLPAWLTGHLKKVVEHGKCIVLYFNDLKEPYEIWTM